MQVDWEGVEGTPEFRELVSKRRSFVVPATIFFLTYYMAFILVTAYAQDFMAERIYEGLTVGYTLALTQFLMVFVLGITYLRRSARIYDPLAERAIAASSAHDTEPSAHPGAGAVSSSGREGAR